MSPDNAIGISARKVYLDPAAGQRLKPGAELGDAYQAANLRLANRQLYRAGTRLAWVLDDVFREVG